MSGPTFQVWLIDPQRARWLWVVLVAVIVSTLACSIGFTLVGQPLPGVLLGTGLATGIAVWYGRWMLVPATVQVGPAKLIITSAEADSNSEALPYSQLVSCIYRTYRAPTLQIFRTDDTQIRLRARGGTTDLKALAQLLQSRLNRHPSRR